LQLEYSTIRKTEFVKLPGWIMDDPERYRLKYRRWKSEEVAWEARGTRHR
jgi:hypothetical protein